MLFLEWKKDYSNLNQSQIYLLTTNLLQYFENNKLYKPGYLQENLSIKEIIDKIDNLSNNLVNVIKDFKEKFDYLVDRIYEYTQINDKKIWNK